MIALVKHGKEFVISQVEQPVIRNTDDVLIQIDLAGVCRTDQLVLEGKIPTPEGTIVGHELCGRVVARGADAHDVVEGARVSVFPYLPLPQCERCLWRNRMMSAQDNTSRMWRGETQNALRNRPPNGQRRSQCTHGVMIGQTAAGAFAEYIVMPKECVYSVDEQTSNQRAAFVEPIAAALGSVDVLPEQIKKIAIFGKNRIAQLTARLASFFGFSEVCVVDSKNSFKQVEDNSFDAVIESELVPDTINQAIRTCRPGGVVVAKTRHSGLAMGLNHELLVHKEITLQGRLYGDFTLAAALASDTSLAIDDLFGAVISLVRPSAINHILEKSETKKQFVAPSLVALTAQEKGKNQAENQLYTKSHLLEGKSSCVA